MVDQNILDEIGFTSFNINDLDKESILEEEVFERIFSTVDQTDRIRLIARLKDRAEELKVKKTFGELLRAYQSDYARSKRQGGSNSMKFTDPPLSDLKCGEWECTDSGVSKVIIKNFEPIKVTACPHPILPVERLQNVETDTEKIKLAFFKDKHWKTITVERSTIASRTKIVQLSDWGIDVTSESAKDLVSYLGDVMNLNDIPLKRSISRLGWVDKDFIPYDGNLTFDGEQDFKALFDSVREHGNFEKWRQEAITLRKYSTYNRLLLAASFSAPLISLLGINPFIVHFWGGTGVGKTVGLMLAASVWGNPNQGKMVRSLNSTQVGMERNSVFLHDLPFIGDELQIIKSNFDNFDKLIMYLCEGVGRGRGRQGGGIEILGNWNCTYIFSGEEPITQTASGGGAKNRAIEIECKKSLVIDGNHTANLLRANYGFAGKKFLDEIPPANELQEIYSAFHSEIMKSGTTEKQAMAMSALLVADNIAAPLIFGDKPLSFSDVTPFMMSVAEIDVSVRAHEWLCDWIGEHYANFVNAANDIWGKIDGDTVYINKTVLEREMQVQGFSFKSCMSAWLDRGIAVKNSQGRSVHHTTCYQSKASYVAIKTDIMQAV